MDLKSPSSLDFPDSWADPDEDRDQVRQRLRRRWLGFSMTGVALGLYSLTTVGSLILFFSGRGQPLAALFGIPQWDLIEGSIVAWGTLLGAALIWGHWPDQNWQRRSGLLLLMCMVDIVLWSLDNATSIGLSEVKVGHEWFRDSLAHALTWSEFALLASLAGDMAAHLGDAQAIDFGKAARSLSTTGAMVWFMYFYFRTDWSGPIWPLRERPINGGSIMLFLGMNVLFAINLVQVTAISLLAGRSCARGVREMAAEDRRNDLLPSRSEAGWEELGRRGSGPPGGA